MTGEATSLRYPQLKEKQQTGSKVRCHLLTHGTKGEVAQRLTRLIEPFGEVLATDSWMPEGFAQCDEAQLHTSERINTDPNPPYSIKQWDRDTFASDPWGRNRFGTPPQGRADYAFWQHILCSLKLKSGRCAILFPHGVLFRKEEADMRSKLIECTRG